MRQQRILSYFISLFAVLLVCVSVQAQNDSIISTVKDTLKIKQKYGLRVGGDIGLPMTILKVLKLVLIIELNKNYISPVNLEPKKKPPEMIT